MVCSCFSGGHVYSLTSLKVITVLSLRSWALSDIRSHGTVAHFSCDALTSKKLYHVHHAACCHNQRWWRRTPTVTAGANPRNRPSSSQPYAWRALCDAMTPVFKNTLLLVCRRWKYSASHYHAKTSLLNAIRLQREMEHSCQIAHMMSPVWMPGLRCDYFAWVWFFFFKVAVAKISFWNLHPFTLLGVWTDTSACREQQVLLITTIKIMMMTMMIFNNIAFQSLLLQIFMELNCFCFCFI